MGAASASHRAVLTVSAARSWEETPVSKTQNRRAVVAPLYPLQFQLPSSHDGSKGRRVLIERPVMFIVKAFSVDADGVVEAPVRDWEFMHGVSDLVTDNGTVFRHRGSVYAMGAEPQVRQAIEAALNAAGYEQVTFSGRR